MWLAARSGVFSCLALVVCKVVSEQRSVSAPAGKLTYTETYNYSIPISVSISVSLSIYMLPS